MIKSKTRVGHIQRVFKYSDETEKKMRVQIARIAVLYDDLMLEYDGAQEETIAALDRSGANSRRFYFVRRSLGTPMELKGAFVVLDGNEAFKSSKKWWDKRDLAQWDAAVKFFQSNQKFLKDWRNDIGGHFLDGAAEYAIDNVHSDALGTIEIYRRGSGADIKMPFAYELGCGFGEEQGREDARGRLPEGRVHVPRRGDEARDKRSGGGGCARDVRQVQVVPWAQGMAE